MEITQMPASAADMVAIAEELVERYLKTQSPVDLIGAVLATSHVADWHFQSKGEKLGNHREAFEAQYPEWKTIRQLGNGIKHPKPFSNEAHHSKLSSRDYEWEDDDAWSHLGTDRMPWYVEHDGKERTIDGLCNIFLWRFKANELPHQ